MASAATLSSSIASFLCTNGSSSSNNKSRRSSGVALPVGALASSSSLRTSPLFAITGTLLLFGSPKHHNSIIIAANSNHVCFRLAGHSYRKTRPRHHWRSCTAAATTTTAVSATAAAAGTVEAAIAEQTTTTTVPAAVADDITTSTIISLLLFIAFVGLTVLTIGVIYIGITDFLQKREGEKFQKEEAEKKKKLQGGGKKRQQQIKARAAGPKGFGQKLVQLDEDDDQDNI